MPVTMRISNRAEEEKKTKWEVNLTRMSQMTGYSLSHLSRVFARINNPSVPCLRRLAEVMGLTMDEMDAAIQERRVVIAKT